MRKAGKFLYQGLIFLSRKREENIKFLNPRRAMAGPSQPKRKAVLFRQWKRLKYMS